MAANSECRGTGKWAQPGVPHKGWTCVGIEDLREQMAICEMCERTEIRYTHRMEHPNYPDQLSVGCVCAGHLEEDLVRAQDRERALQSVAARRARWLTRRWRVSARGNSFLITDGYLIVVFPRGEGWAYHITNRATEATYASSRPYRTEASAKLGAFDKMIFLNTRTAPSARRRV